MAEQKTIAPGMERVIEAGDTLVITDREGQEFAVSARESDVVMRFLSAFDSWYLAKVSGVEGLVLDGLWRELEQQFSGLPIRIQHELPSFRAIGVRVAMLDH